jgi:hypothetical protein
MLGGTKVPWFFELLIWKIMICNLIFFSCFFSFIAYARLSTAIENGEPLFQVDYQYNIYPGGSGQLPGNGVQVSGTKSCAREIGEQDSVTRTCD